MNTELQDLLARQAITQTLLRYTRGIDRADRELIRSVYHDDAVDNHGPFTGGPDEFVDWAMALMENFEVSQHSMSNIQIDVQGDRANVEIYLKILHVLKTPRVEEVIFTRLLDLFEKRGGAWKIARRTVVIDYSMTQPVSAPYSAKGSYAVSARHRSDPVYANHWASAPGT